MLSSSFFGGSIVLGLLSIFWMENVALLKAPAFYDPKNSQFVVACSSFRLSTLFNREKSALSIVIRQRQQAIDPGDIKTWHDWKK